MPPTLPATAPPLSAVTATIDTTAPAETFASTIGTNTGATSTIASGGLTKDNTLALSGTVSDASGVSSVQVYDGATLLGTATVSAGTWSYTTAALADGSHSFTANATDTAGNSTTTAAVTATIDTTAPVVTENLASDTGVIVERQDHLERHPDRSGDPNAVVHFTVDGNPIAGTATANASGTWTFTPTGLSDGSHTIVASETDAAGNTGSTSFTFTLDTTAPAAPTIGSFTPNGTALTLSGTAEANSTVKVYDNGTLLGSATVNGSGAWTYTTAALGSSTNAFTATATDAAGNTSLPSSDPIVTMGMVVSSGQVEIVHSGDTDFGTVVNGGGTQQVWAGGVANGTTISSGGQQLVYGSASSTTVGSGGQEFVLSGGTASASLVSGGGVAVVHERRNRNRRGRFWRRHLECARRGHGAGRYGQRPADRLRNGQQYDRQQRWPGAGGVRGHGERHDGQ